MCKEESAKKEISGAYLTGERPLFGGKNLSIQDTIFTDGESPLKEASDIDLKNSMFQWKYPLWYAKNITAEDCTNIRTTAKEIQVPEKQFIAWMLKNKYLYRTAKGYLMPYAKKSNEGLFIVKDFYYGYGQIAHHTLITPNGKLLFMRLASRIRESA